MKTLFACFAALLFVAATARPAQADHTIPVDVFYDALAPYGDWVDVEGYGYCFRPTVTVEDAAWRPYNEGSWVYTDAGWTWESDEDFGWATYHYGRWFLVGDTWLWTPGDGVWGPAWVSWRTSDDYVGWAPLPPDAYWQPDTGFGTYVDIDYDIGPAYYSFVSVRYLGDRHLRHWIEPWQRNVDYCRHSENRTRITHRTTNNYITQIYNDGPDYTLLSRRSEQPIRRLSLAQQDTVNFRQSGSRLRNTVQNDSLQVIAPRVDRVEDRTLKPKAVAAQLDQTKVRRGWERYKDEEVRDLRAKVETAKRESNRQVPRDPNRDVTRSTATTKALPADATTATTTDTNAAAGGKMDRKNKNGAQAPTAVSTDATTANTNRKGKDGKGANKTSDAATAKTDRDSKIQDQPPKALPSDRSAAASSSAAEERMRARSAEDRDKVNSEIPGSKKDDKTSKSGAADREELRKAVPVTPESATADSARKGGEGNAKKPKIQPLEPGPDAKPPGASERMRVGPQDAPPRSQVGPGAGVNRPDENLPGPSKKKSAGEDSGNTQRPGPPKMKPQVDNTPTIKPQVDNTPKIQPSQDNLPKVKPNQDGVGAPKTKPGRSDVSPQKRVQPAPQIQPQPQPQIQPQPQARKIEKPKPQAPPQPAPQVQVPTAPPPTAIQGTPPSGKPGKGGATKTEEDDKKKKKQQ